MDVETADRTVTEQESGERHPPEIKKALKQIVEDYTLAERSQRRALLRRVSKQRAFYKGDPVGWFDPEILTWAAAETAPRNSRQNAPLYQYNVNIYQAVGLILASAIASAGMPGTIFVPQNPNDPADISVARQGRTIADFQASQQDMFSKWIDLQRLFFTDGPVLGFIRHVKDGSRYGYHNAQVPQIGQATIGQAGFDCPQCGGFTPESALVRGDLGGMYCQGERCGAPLGQENFREPYQTLAPMGFQDEREPKGMEIFDLFGVLESHMAWWVRDLHGTPFAGIEVEVHQDTLAASFPEQYDLIRAQRHDRREDAGVRAAALSPVGSQATLQSSSATLGQEQLVTYRRWFLRPEAFFHFDERYGQTVENDRGVRAELLEQYPEGAMVQFADEEFLDCVPARMDEHLVLAKPLASDSIYCPSLGESMVPIQEALNTAFNLQIESMEYAAFAPILADQKLVPRDLTKKKMRPAEWTFVEVPPDKQLAGCVWQPEIKEASKAVQIVIEEAFKWSEYLAGAQPALFGASVTNIRTNAAYMTARNQALGRLSIPWQMAKNAWAAIQERMVVQYARNRSRTEVFALLRADALAPWVSKEISIIQGGKVFARVESSETIPATYSQKQAALQMILQAQNPVLQGTLSDPDILHAVFEFLGIPEIEAPIRVMREKYLRLIPRLLQETPRVEMDPIMGVPIILPSVAFDPVLDQGAIALFVMQKWSAGEEAQGLVNTPGYDNVRAFAQEAMKSIAPPLPPEAGAGKQGEKPSAPESGETPPARIERQVE